MYCTYLKKFIWNYYLLCYFLFNVIESVLSEHRIAIIGAGIGGTSCAYFLQELLGDDVKIDVFEKSEVGGRLATVKYGSAEYETGGYVIHKRHKYMRSFVKKFGLKRMFPTPEGKVVFAKGKQPIFKTSKWNIITAMKSFWKYGLAIFKLPYFIINLLDSFDKIYDEQSQHTSFKTVRDLLNAMDPTFPGYLDINCRDGFAEYAGDNDNIMLEIIQGALTVNYGQTVDVPMFAGVVSASYALSGMWSVEGGNKLIASHCLEKSKATFRNYEVNKIIRDDDKNIFNIEAKNDEETIKLQYDIVVVATPITADMKSKIEFINFQNPIEVKGNYQKTVTTILKGNLKDTVLDHTKIGDVIGIINLNEGELISTISKIQPVCESNSSNNDNIWTIISNRELTNKQIGYLFNDAHIIDVSDWLAYPQYKWLNRKDNFVLDYNLFYINAIEWAASAMEMSVISAKNVALLIEKEIKRV